MPGARRRGQDVRDFIVNNVSNNSKSIVSFTAKHFGISRTAVHKHITKLINENILIFDQYGYSLKSDCFECKYKITKCSEDAVWEIDIKKHFQEIPENIKRILIYGFMEIFNNAIEHSQGKNITVIIKQNKIFIEMWIIDDGIGIFTKIKNKFNLLNKEDSLLELSKGKRTTDRSRHSGQGIFFTSKMFDYFMIYSDKIQFISGDNEDSNEIMPTPEEIKIKTGTLVVMRLLISTTRTTKEIFDSFSKKEFEFDRTIIPVKMAMDNDLVSRSQARRILNGLELFTEVILDFNSIQYIGQSFADELFRVFPSMNPGTTIIEKNTNAEVQSMINRARNTRL
jgi:anti-sigma regulatory factor (Ser/Thr protein kinase)